MTVCYFSGFTAQFYVRSIFVISKSNGPSENTPGYPYLDISDFAE